MEELNPAPIVTEPDQPDCFEYALLQLETKMLIKGLTWQSDRVLRLIYQLHAAYPWVPTNHETARLGLSYEQLRSLLQRLELPDRDAQILSLIQSRLDTLNLSWESDRVVDYLNKLHSAIGWNPITPEQSRLGLNRNQLLTLLKKLNHATT